MDTGVYELFTCSNGTSVTQDEAYDLGRNPAAKKERRKQRQQTEKGRESRRRCRANWHRNKRRRTPEDVERLKQRQVQLRKAEDRKRRRREKQAKRTANREKKVDEMTEELAKAYSEAPFCVDDMESMQRAVVVLKETKELREKLFRVDRLAACHRDMESMAQAQRNIEVILVKCFRDKDGVVCQGRNYDGKLTKRGTHKRPVVFKRVSRGVARKRCVVMIDEFRTTKNCFVCGKYKGRAQRLEWGTPREQRCPGCGTEVVRDLNAAWNIREVFVHWVLRGTRPGWLSFDLPPETVENFALYLELKAILDAVVGMHETEAVV